MVVAHNVRVHKPQTTDTASFESANIIVSTAYHSEIGYGGDSYSPGLSIPFRCRVYAARVPANRRHYKHQTL